MFEWMPYVGSELTTLSDAGNSYYITPVSDQDKAGPWTCAAIMLSGAQYNPRIFPNRQKAEHYAEEIEVASWLDEV